jgi:hypothetical protein
MSEKIKNLADCEVWALFRFFNAQNVRQDKQAFDSSWNSWEISLNFSFTEYHQKDAFRVPKSVAWTFQVDNVCLNFVGFDDEWE